MIPPGLEHHHFLKAIRVIDRDGVPASRASYRYDLILRGKAYPPKYVISIATKIARGEEWAFTKFNAVEAKNYFRGHGFTISEKTGEKRRVIAKIADEDAASRFAEGERKYRLHRSLERDPSITRKAKQARLAAQQDLCCDVCGFSFFESYGELGSGFIEAHHTVPVSEIQGSQKTKISDIALVCANCHQMLHRATPLLSIEQLRTIVERNQQTES